MLNRIDGERERLLRVENDIGARALFVSGFSPLFLGPDFSRTARRPRQSALRRRNNVYRMNIDETVLATTTRVDFQPETQGVFAVLTKTYARRSSCRYILSFPRPSDTVFFKGVFFYPLVFVRSRVLATRRHGPAVTGTRARENDRRFVVEFPISRVFKNTNTRVFNKTVLKSV